MNADALVIIREFLVDQTVLTDLIGGAVSPRIFVPRVPERENNSLPAIGFFKRGGWSHAYIKGELHPSIQFDCWADDPLEAEEVYRALYDVLQGIQNETVTVDGTDYMIWSALEEVQGQDLQDVDIPDRFRVMTFFSFMIKAE